PSETIPELSSNRRKVDSEGIAKADVVLVPLEDGDRTEALKAIEKFVITIDLNPMSRTAVYSDITIVDNIVRAAPLMVQYARDMKDWPREKLDALVTSFDNRKNLNSEVSLMRDHLRNQIDSIYKEDKP
ncbi:MAG: phosphopantothenate/pantothenate synthetase family protein, partial [Candidatus Thorarchaeota archaeon]